MSDKIHEQIEVFLAALCSGMALMFCYEVLRLLRWLIWHGKIAVWVEDILYWLIASVPVFYVFFVYADGEIRWYGIFMLLLGIYFYEAGISRPVRKFLTRIFGRHKPSVLNYIKSRRKQKTH